MLGTEPRLLADYVESGRVKIVFWPVLNHGNPSVYSTLTAECAGRQDPALFWAAHKALFDAQDGLWAASRDDYVALAAGIGADRAAFEACYDGGEALDHVMALDAQRRERGVVSQPTFEIGGQLTSGLQPYEFFQAALDAALQSTQN